MTQDMPTPAKSGRLIVISNRIPTEAEPSGGLVVALHEALGQQGGVWIGSSGDAVEQPKAGLTRIASGAYDRMSFDLSAEDYEQFYLGYANSVLWPLFHRRADLMDVQPGFAEGYARVNDRLADMIAAFTRPDDLIWVHDYHFLPLADALRQRGLQNRIGFFLHIPFPSASDVPALPQADALKTWVAGYDVFGLQTEGDVMRCRALFRLDDDAEFFTSGAVRLGGRSFHPHAFPIGIDAHAFREMAINSTAGDTITMARGQKLVLGVDRLDYSKGLVHRFEGFAAYLTQRPDDAPRATLLQIAPPSREEVGAYQDIRQELESAAGSINGDHSELDWTPIRYIRRSVPRDDLAGLYARADCAMVTPLADGMNLVAKEFVAAQDPDDPGVLILSHFAGAAEQMPEALLVNPYDAQEVGDAVTRALIMPLAERKARHAALWKNVSEQDIAWWSSRWMVALTQGIAPLSDIAPGAETPAIARDTLEPAG